MQESTRANETGDLKLAVKKARKAMRIRDSFAAHLSLASALNGAYRLQESAEEYDAAARLATKEEDMLYATAAAFNDFKVCSGRKPEWWNDAELLSLSKRATEAHPSYPLAWDMRGHVLAGEIDWPNKRERGVVDLLHAARAFEKHAVLNAVWRDDLVESSEICMLRARDLIDKARLNGA